MDLYVYQTYLEMGIQQLTASKNVRKWLNRETFLAMENTAKEEILNLPVASRLREIEFSWGGFESNVFYPFVDGFIVEIEEAFMQLEFWANLSIFDPRKLPVTKLQLPSYGNDEFDRLLSHYGESKTDTFKGNVVNQEADIDPLKSKAEWSGFKLMIYLKREAYEKNIDMKIAAVQNPGNEGKAEVARLQKV